MPDHLHSRNLGLIYINPVVSIMRYLGDYRKFKIVDEPDKLRKLASWYRVFAERTGNPAIWEGRLRMAEDLDSEAERIERTLAVTSVGPLER